MVVISWILLHLDLSVVSWKSGILTGEMQYGHKSSILFFTQGWILYHLSHDKAWVVAAMFPHRLHLQNISTTNFALSGINTTVKMWIYFCRCCSVTAVKNKQCYWFSWNASCRASIKARLFYQFTYFEQRVYFFCNSPLGTPCRSVCFLLCKCNFCSLTSVFWPTSVILCMCCCWIWERSVLRRKHGFGFLKDSWL